MPRTLEERMTEELDDLFRGALFLCAGDRDSAEVLLVEMVGEAGSPATSGPGTRTGEARGEPTLEHHLVRTFLTGSRARRWAPSRAVRCFSGDDDGETVLTAAAAVPPRARAALWLVVIQRRSYADTAHELDVELATLDRLLEHRERFATAAMGIPALVERAAEGA